MPTRPAIPAMLLAPLLACTQAPAQPVQIEAEQLYHDGMEHLSGGALLEAEQEFVKLTKLPSYLGLTALARLRLADAQFHQQKHDEAIETYHSFVARHDGNENVPYAQFMVAKAHVELMPSDLWVLPPVYELDLSAVQQARQQLERFVRQYPRSRYTTEALQLRDRCVGILQDHHRYVVAFYRDRGQWEGVVSRMHQMMQQFPSSSHTLANYVLLVEAYEKLRWRGRALELWQAIGARWPDSVQGRRAQDEAARLQRAIADAKARGEAAEMPLELPPMATVKPERLADREVEEG